MVIDSLVLSLSPCWWWMPLHAKCNVALSVGSGKPCSMGASLMLDRYTYSVLYETCWDTWAQKCYSVSDDPGNEVILN